MPDPHHRAETQQLRTLIEHFPSGAVLLFDHELRYVVAGGEAWVHTDYSPHEVIGRPIGDILPAHTCATLEPHLRAGLAGERRTFEVTYAQRIFEMRVSPMKDESDTITSVLAVAQDVTERVHVANALREAEQFQDRILRASPDILYVFDLEEQSCVFSNDRIHDILGLSAADVKAMSSRLFEHLLHPEDAEKVHTHLAGWRDAQQKEVREISYRMRHADGSWRHLRSREVILSRDDAGHPRTLLGAAEDITERILLEEQLRQSSKMEAIGKLAGGVAHDFNNILTAIMGHIELANELLTDPADISEARGCVDQIARSSDRAAKLVRQLLVFSRREPIQTSTVDLNATLRELEPMLRRVVPEDIVITLQTAAAPASVEIDVVQFEQAVLNIVLNARDAMPDGGDLQIRVTADQARPRSMTPQQAAAPAYHVISIRDTGSGMDEATAARIFEPFFTTKPPGRGTGMGLAMVRAFVEQAGGEIDVHSRINDGTEITLALPRSATAVPDAPNPSETVVNSDSLPPGNETILVCEDDAPIRQLALRTLSRLGYNVLPAADAENALAIAADFERPIDLLLTDVIMPGMSGDALASRLRARYADLRVLFVSGYTADHLDEKSLDGPQSRLLSKPFTPAQLAGAVRAILDNSAANTL